MWRIKKTNSDYLNLKRMLPAREARIGNKLILLRTQLKELDKAVMKDDKVEIRRQSYAALVRLEQIQMLYSKFDEDFDKFFYYINNE